MRSLSCCQSTAGAARADRGADGEPPGEIVLAARGTVPKTAGGMIGRAATLDRYQAGPRGRPGRGARWLAAGSAAPGLRLRRRRAARSGGTLLYTGCAWVATVIVGVPAWLLGVQLA
jgi:hypothetical protein